MAWPKGKKRPEGAGRKKGTPNKKTVEFLQILENNNFDPAAELIYCYRELKKIADHRKKNGNYTGAVVAFQAAEKTANDISQFVYPKKKAIEHTGEVGVRTFADFIAAGEDEDDDA